MNDSTSIAWLGLDAHSKNCLLGHLDNHGTEIKWWQFATQPQLLIKHVQAIPATDKRLMLEESNLARWIAQLLKPHVQQIVVCDARRNRLISHDHHKHDKRDAFALARLLRLNDLLGHGFMFLLLRLWNDRSKCSGIGNDCENNTYSETNR